MKGETSQKNRKKNEVEDAALQPVVQLSTVQYVQAGLVVTENWLFHINWPLFGGQI